MEFIELEEIRKTYYLGEVSLPVLNGISMSIPRGGMVALMGSSGSGKSTLMNILGCLDHPTSGRYWFDGQEISCLTAKERARLRNRMIGFVFQSFNLLPRMTALENVLVPLMYTREDLSDREMARRAAELLVRFGLGDRLDHQPSQLSGGQQQRVAIARALVNRPEVLLADEPTGNLDSRTGEELLQMFDHLHEVERITIVLVTHDAGVARHAQRIMHIRDGLIDNGGPQPPEAPHEMVPHA
jgi:ABC-type lipoprotein export system ATPase subunit